MKHYTNAIIFGIAIVASSIFLGKAYTDRNKVDGEIEVTGLGKTDFSVRYQHIRKPNKYIPLMAIMPVKNLWDTNSHNL
ncbi:hypothetical protein [Formosa algae]|uniref:hypothetical protein n=1 Tax=Formosa algae TaxID=225843 RepID=UPI0026822A53